MNERHKLVLVVLDGWGLGAGDRSDAIAQADTPFMDHLMCDMPHAHLRTDGEHVGLPPGQMGNSEVGHLNIGAGRVVHQELARIGKAIEEGSLERNKVLQEAFEKARSNEGRLHFIGLLSKGGVHSHQDHLAALCAMAHRAGVTHQFIHAFTDGRDADPRSGLGYYEEFMKAVSGLPVRVATVVGRYYAMDRDKRWERIRRAYDLLVHGRGTAVRDAREAYVDSYAKGITDEFILPHVVVDPHDNPVATIRPGDVVICFNFRTDRCREITMALTQQAFPEQGMEPLALHYVTMTEYDPTYRNVEVVLRKEGLPMTLGEVISKAGLRQLRIAETEKYPHVTYFFNGGRETPFVGEERIMIPSPKVATYDLQPEMSAEGVTEAVIDVLNSGDVDLVVLNFANPDMVGHTGVFPAIIKAVETIDRCTQRVVETGRAMGYSFVIIADHGNADQARNADGTPNTAHSTNPVPLIVLDDRKWTIQDGILADVAPTVLRIMGLDRPAEMTGKVLVRPA
ncbi:MAG: 2,3-bisphosphoglycerate-independent phosphoglycerate mutase [Flavobacteriales bacterium]|nr:2,3-bisphosphoglycerate-independent phosphoglycerate mutase [Flavobacteriales bacterium]MCB9193392.1 2,3-bisphosphoglycerate-independent phosphoglycerate mutase [Flavobacteriales bacterium]